MSSGTGAAVGLAVLAAIAVIVVALRPTMVEIQSSPDAGLSDFSPLSAEGPDDARVRGSSQSSGVSVLGVSFGRSTHLNVEFLAARECLDLIDYGDPWPAAAPECASAVPVSGEVSGLGISPTGESVIVVEFEVTRDCYAAVAVGMPWPTGLAECAAAEQADR